MTLSYTKTSRICWRMSRLLFLFLGILLFLIVWFEFPLQRETYQLNLKLQNKLDQINIKLHECLINKFGQQAIPAKMQVENVIPKIPENETTKYRRFQGLKLVHLDLKGAPPKIDYLLQLLPVFKEMGADGLLIEYEDMFPYHGNIRILSSENAYSYSDIKSLLSKAEEMKFEVVPLIQTLGHFEFVLKHGEFHELRETPQYPNMPCPLHSKTQDIVTKMLNQVLELHPGISRIHLGGDEVFNLKDCERCKKSDKTKEHLFLHHMLPLLQHVQTKTNNKVKPIIWDDMLRKWTVEDMKQISTYADIMVWAYAPSLEKYPMFPNDMWDKYGEVFDQIWIASSFKGAISANNNLVPIPMHLQNHESWIQITKRITNKVVGVAITGWARYDHFAALCELLPQALPSLALCLSVLREGSFKPRGRDGVETQLGFQKPIDLKKELFGSWDTSLPNYPGGDVYSLVAELENHVSWYESAKTRIDSWSNERQVEENKISLLQIHGVVDTLKQLLPSFHNFRKKCFDILKTYFFDDTVTEWVRDKVDTYIELSEKLVKKVKLINTKLKLKIEL